MCSRYRSWLGHQSTETIYLPGQWSGGGKVLPLGLTLGEGELALPPCVPRVPHWRAGGTLGCHQGAIRASAATAASGWHWCFPRAPVRTAALHMRSRQRLVAEEQAQAACPRPSSCWGPGGSTALPPVQAWLPPETSHPHFLCLVGVSELFRSSQKLLTLPHDRGFPLGNTSEN